VVVALLLALAAAADPTPLANQPISGQGTITAAQSSFEIQLDNGLSGPSILVWFVGRSRSRNAHTHAPTQALIGASTHTGLRR